MNKNQILSSRDIPAWDVVFKRSTRSSMKTLNQAELRTLISSFPYTISNSGLFQIPHDRRKLRLIRLLCTSFRNHFSNDLTKPN